LAITACGLLGPVRFPEGPFFDDRDKREAHCPGERSSRGEKLLADAVPGAGSDLPPVDPGAGTIPGHGDAGGKV
jgi:hypothetical protein